MISLPSRLIGPEVEPLLSLLRDHSSLRALTLSNSLIEKNAGTELARLTQLQCLNLRSILDGNLVVSDCLRTLSNIRELDIRGCYFGDATHAATQHTLLSNNQLTHLAMDIDPHSTGTEVISRAIAWSTSLRSLSVSNMRDVPLDWNFIRQYNTTLTDLTWNDVDSRESDEGNIVDAVVGLALQKLTLIETRFSATMFRDQRTIVTLDLSYNSDFLTNDVFSSVMSMQQLQHFYARRARLVSGDAIIAMAYKESLQTFDIGEVELTLRVYQLLAESGLRHLLLNCFGCQGFLATGDAVVGFFEQQTSFETLDLTITQLSPVRARSLMSRTDLKGLAIDATTWANNEADAIETLRECRVPRLTLSFQMQHINKFGFLSG